MVSIQGATAPSGPTLLPPLRSRRLLASHAYRLGYAAAGVGFLLLVLGFVSASVVPPVLYFDRFSGYDPPFEAIAGLLLIALSFRIRDRSPVAWLFSILAPILTVSVAILSPNVCSVTSAVAATALVMALFPYRGGFFRGSATGPEATQLMVIVAALITILFGVVGSRSFGGQFRPAIRGWGEGIYFTIATISTNGTVYQPASDAARWFTTLLILFGVGTFLSAVVVLFLPFLERRLERIARRLERAQMEDLDGHVIICGVSAEARATADALRGQGIRAVMISLDAPVVERLRAEGYRAHFGDSSSEEELVAVGVGRARALVAAGDSDAENLLTVITARGMQPKLRIVAVASASSSLAKFRKAGADDAISLVSVAAELVSAAALRTASGAHSVLPPATS